METDTPKYSFRVRYSYSGSDDAQFNFYGTNADFVMALAAVFSDPFAIYHMTIEGFNPFENQGSAA